MRCAENPENSLMTCWPLALQLFPLTFWRNITADTARATFGTIFFIVEITKGYQAPHEVESDIRDFWRALKERHPFALSIARGPKKPSKSTTSTSQSKRSSFGFRFPLHKLPPILPSRIRDSLLRRQSTPQPLIGTTAAATTPTLAESPTIQLPEFAFRRPDLDQVHHTFPRSQSAPRVYLHTPQWEIDGTPPPPPSAREFRRFSLPSTIAPASSLAVNSAMHIPVSAPSSAMSSTRISLLSVATDSLALGSKLESCVDV